MIDLDAIKERAEKASPGPWTAVHGDKHNAYPCVCIKSRGRELLVWDVADDAPTEFPGREEDADFVAHAREDIPALLSEVEALRKELPSIAVLENMRLERDALRAKLEKAKEALVDLRNAETNGSIRYNGILRCEIIRKALAELADKKEPQT